MISGETWRGPFESRREFESVQDKSIADLARFAYTRPTFTDDPARLKDQLWGMGKYLPAATLGLGRHNPDNAELLVWDNPPVYREERPGYTIGRGQGPTRHRGETAYERMVNSWHDVSGLADSTRFEVKTSGPNGQLDLVHLAPDARTMIVGDAVLNKVYQQVGLFVELLDTDQTDNRDEINWAEYIAHDGSPLYEPTDNPPPHYLISPFSDGETDPAKVSEADIVSLAGEAAVDVFGRYGEVGLYQHLLWTKVNTLLLRLDLGPADKL